MGYAERDGLVFMGGMGFIRTSIDHIPSAKEKEMECKERSTHW